MIQCLIALDSLVRARRYIDAFRTTFPTHADNGFLSSAEAEIKAKAKVSGVSTLNQEIESRVDQLHEESFPTAGDVHRYEGNYDRVGNLNSSFSWEWRTIQLWLFYVISAGRLFEKELPLKLWK